MIRWKWTQRKSLKSKEAFYFVGEWGGKRSCCRALTTGLWAWEHLCFVPQPWRLLSGVDSQHSPFHHTSVQPNATSWRECSAFNSQGLWGQGAVQPGVLAQGKSETPKILTTARVEPLPPHPGLACPNSGSLCHPPVILEVVTQPGGQVTGQT